MERLHILYGSISTRVTPISAPRVYKTDHLLFTGESPVPSVSSGGAAVPMCTSTVTHVLSQAKPSSSSQQDRKVPPPIGTERRNRQTVNILPTSYTPPVGQGGIWSFGVGSASGK